MLFCSVGIQLFHILVSRCLYGKWWRDVLSTAPSVVSALVFRPCSIQKRRGVLDGLGRAAAAAYQYSKRALSETITSPVGPSARQSLFMDAEHASCHLVRLHPSVPSPPSPLPSSFRSPLPLNKHKIPVTFFHGQTGQLRVL